MINHGHDEGLTPQARHLLAEMQHAKSGGRQVTFLEMLQIEDRPDRCIAELLAAKLIRRLAPRCYEAI